MRLVIQRVSKAHVTVDSKTVGQIGAGILILLGIAKEDTEADCDYLVKKVIELRMFEDDKGNLNLSSQEINAEFLVVSQFTLYGDLKKGRRPSFEKAADPKRAEELYNYFLQTLKSYNVKVEAGVFRAMMEVHLVNDGPVTFIMESKEK